MVFGLKDKETWKYCETDKHIVVSGLFKRSVNYVINIEQLQSHPSFVWFKVLVCSFERKNSHISRVMV